jgi:hypothetical protein
VLNTLAYGCYKPNSGRRTVREDSVPSRLGYPDDGSSSLSLASKTATGRLAITCTTSGRIGICFCSPRKSGWGQDVAGAGCESILHCDSDELVEDLCHSLPRMNQKNLRASPPCAQGRPSGWLIPGCGWITLPRKRHVAEGGLSGLHGLQQPIAGDPEYLPLQDHLVSQRIGGVGPQQAPERRQTKATVSFVRQDAQARQRPQHGVQRGGVRPACSSQDAALLRAPPQRVGQVQRRRDIEQRKPLVVLAVHVYGVLDDADLQAPAANGRPASQLTAVAAVGQEAASPRQRDVALDADQHVRSGREHPGDPVSAAEVPGPTGGHQ